MPFATLSRSTRTGADRMPLILAAIVLGIAAVDCVWQAMARFDVDTVSYARLALLAFTLAAGGVFYDRVRSAPHIAAMFFGTAFLIGFSGGLSILNYFLLTVARVRIDTLLAHVDVALGVNWPALVTSMVAHPFANGALRIAYVSVLPQVALLVVYLGWKERSADIYQFCLALGVGALITVAFWTVFPSFGAFSVYELPDAVSRHLHLALDSTYAHQLVGLLVNGPGRIAPDQLKGLIGFPSFHATMAMLVVWYARSSRFLFWCLFAWNAAVLVSTPIHGGHHVIDVPAGVIVSAAAIALAARIGSRASGESVMAGAGATGICARPIGP